MSLRPVKKLSKSKPTLEGAGVHLRRAFGFGNTSDFDPFLLLDDFRNDIPEDYLAPEQLLLLPGGRARLHHLQWHRTPLEMAGICGRRDGSDRPLPRQPCREPGRDVRRLPAHAANPDHGLCAHG